MRSLFLKCKLKFNILFWKTKEIIYIDNVIDRCVSGLAVNELFTAQDTDTLLEKIGVQISINPRLKTNTYEHMQSFSLPTPISMQDKF